jgi:hypothetical protein
MDGFTIDPAHFGTMIGQVNDIADSLGSAAKSFDGAQGVDLGHPILSSTAGNLLGGLGEKFDGFSGQAAQLGVGLGQIQQSYLDTDAAAAGALAGAGSTSASTGADPFNLGTSGGSNSDDPTRHAEIPYAGTGIGLDPHGGIGPIQ